MNLEQIKTRAFNSNKDNEKKLAKQKKTSIKTYDCLVKHDYLNKANYENDKEFYNQCVINAKILSDDLNWENEFMRLFTTIKGLLEKR